MKICKKISLLGLSALAVFGLSACGSQNQDSQSNKQQQQVQKKNDATQNGQQNNNSNNDHDGASQKELANANKLTKEDSKYVKNIDVQGPEIWVTLQPSTKSLFVAAQKDVSNDMKHMGSPRKYPMNSTDKQATNICKKIRSDIEKKVSNDSQINFMKMLGSNHEYDDKFFHGISSSDFGYGGTTHSIQNEP